MKDEEDNEDIIAAPCEKNLGIEQDKGLASYCPWKNSKFDNAFFYELEMSGFEDKPLESEEYSDMLKGGQDYEESEDLFTLG